MTLKNSVGALVLTALAFAPSMALAQTAKVDDSTLDNRIEARIKASATLKHDNIDVAVDNGVVTLTGKVASAAHSTRAASLAKIAGVTRVDNRLEIDETLARKADKTMDKAMDKAEDKADRAKDKADKAADKADSKTDRAIDKTKGTAGGVGDAVTDAWIITKLKADFVNEDTLKGSDINVDADNHVVTLKGTVMTTAGRTRAMQIARTTKGVTRVIDALTIGPKK